MRSASRTSPVSKRMRRREASNARQATTFSNGRRPVSGKQMPFSILMPFPSRQRLDFAGGFAADGPVPGSIQFVLVDGQPGGQDAHLLGRKGACQQFAVDADGGFVFGVEDVDMRLVVLPVVGIQHPNDKIVESGKFGHGCGAFCNGFSALDFTRSRPERNRKSLVATRTLCKRGQEVTGPGPFSATLLCVLHTSA